MELISTDMKWYVLQAYSGYENKVKQSLEDMIQSVTELNPDIDGVEKSIFDGNYPTNISKEYLENLEKMRG